jgi:hypothetical protein
VRWGRKRAQVEEVGLFFSIASPILPRTPLEQCAHEPLGVESGPWWEFNPDYREVPQAQIVEENQGYRAVDISIRYIGIRVQSP